MTDPRDGAMHSVPCKAPSESPPSSRKERGDYGWKRYAVQSDSGARMIVRATGIRHARSLAGMGQRTTVTKLED